MSTQFDTRPASPSYSDDRAPRPDDTRRSGYRLAVISIGSAIAAALVALAAIGLTHNHTTTHTNAPVASTSAPAAPTTAPSGATTPSAYPAQPTTPATRAASTRLAAITCGWLPHELL